MTFRFLRFGSLLLATTLFVCALAFGCAAGGSKDPANGNSTVTPTDQNSNVSANDRTASKIEVVPGSPSETVRAFYQKIREKKFREALFLTNLRPAIEGLTDLQLKEFQVDLESIAAEVPQDVQINGEVISGETAVVMANLPGTDPNKLETQKIDLRREGDHWIILTVDPASEKIIKEEGNNYFYALRMETQQKEAEKLLNRIADVESVYGMRNQANYADADTLIAEGLLDAELKSGESTGYRFVITLAPDKKSYYATATPIEYGKSGKLSLIMIADGKTPPHLVQKDNKGKPLVNK